METETEVVSLSPDQIRELIACRLCNNTLKHPVTTQCGISYCRQCLLDSGGCSFCPKDECRQYCESDCQVDLTLQHVVDKLSHILESANTVSDTNLLPNAQKSLESDMAMSCPLCLKRLLHPVTTQCGHTFCQNCVRWLMETTLVEVGINCPICRGNIGWSFKLGVADHHDPMADWSHNKILTTLIWNCWSMWVRQKVEKVEKQESLVPVDMDIAVFVCTASWPGQNTLLRVFEPRYRRMLRRTMDTSHKTFGMVMKNADGNTDESRVGTLLKVEKIIHGLNHSIYIQTIGVSRFRIKEGARIHDGYWVASIDTLVDDPLVVDWTYRDRTPTNDEATRLLRYGFAPSTEDIVAAIQIYQDEPALVHCLSNAEIMSIIRQYVDMRLALHSVETRRIVFAQLRMPPTDNIDMIWWFSHVLGLRGEVAAKMLASTSVRFRLEFSLWYIICHIPDHYARIWNIE
jgi:Lon protease-like protein